MGQKYTRLDKARFSFYTGDEEGVRKAHEGNILESEEKHNHIGKYLKSIVYGGLDGIITTFAVVAGVSGARLEVGVVLIMGFANLIADGISMGMGDFLSSRAEKEFQTAEKSREMW